MLTSSLSLGWSCANTIGGFDLSQLLVDLGPHILKGLGGATRDVDLGPWDGLVIVDYSDNVHQKVELDMPCQRDGCGGGQVLTLASVVHAPALVADPLSSDIFNDFRRVREVNNTLLVGRKVVDESREECEREG